jgi:peptide/nickel transport system substrate-binding protein
MPNDHVLRPSRRDVLKYGAAAAAALALGPLAASCTSGATSSVPKKGGTLKFAAGDGGTQDTFDPALTFTWFLIVGGAMLYDRLLNMDANWNLTPGLAEEWSSTSDLKTYTFKIRRGVQFHSGKTLTSADPATQLRRVLDPAIGAASYAVLSLVLDPSGITTPDDQTLVCNLKIPDAFFGVRVAHYGLAIPQSGIKDWINGASGTGPFKLQAFQPGAGFQFVRNPAYWQSGRPYLDGVNCVNIPDQTTKAQAILTGDADVGTDLSASNLGLFQSSTTATLIDLGPQPFLIDVDGSIKPYSDPRVSKALKMLIDRKKMLEIVARGRGLVSADVMVAPIDPLYPTDLKPFSFDPEQAKSLLAQAGYAGGFKDDIWTTTAYAFLDEGAAFAKQAFAAAHLDMTINSVDVNAYGAANLVKPVVMDSGLRLHPVIEVEQFYASRSGLNVSRIRDQQIDQWLVEVKSTVDVSKQKQVMSDLLHRYNDISAEINPFHFTNLWPVKKRIKGIVVDPMTVFDFREATLA